MTSKQRAEYDDAIEQSRARHHERDALTKSMLQHVSPFSVIDRREHAARVADVVVTARRAAR